MGTITKRESLGRTELERLVTLALDEAQRRGVDQAEAAASKHVRYVTRSHSGSGREGLHICDANGPG